MYNEKIKEILDDGRRIRLEQIRIWKEEIPKIREVIRGNKIYLGKWFNKYIKLINFGAREFREISKKKNKIKIVYTNFANSKKKLFINYLPDVIKLDKDFQYFLSVEGQEKSSPKTLCAPALETILI